MDAEKIAKQARKSLGKYCMQECHAYCCRKGYLILDKELNLVVNGKKDLLLQNNFLKKMENGKYSLFLGNPEGCPMLKDFGCMIHKKRNRPLACREFPLFLKDNKIILSSRCPAVKENKLFPYVKKLEALGYKVDKDNNDDFETFSNLNFAN